MIKNRLSITELSMTGLKKITNLNIEDQRGVFTRIFCANELRKENWNKQVAQINFTITLEKGTVRGLHYQSPPATEMKLITCIEGEIFDVVVDIRSGSPTFLNWHAEKLSARKGDALLIPEGFAHGFQSLVDNVKIIYCHSNEYIQELDKTLNQKDPLLKIEWPLKISKISDKDKNSEYLNEYFPGI